MVVIGLVGGVASGKSLVASEFARLGAAILDADRVGHEVLRDREVQEEIKQAWGTSLFGHDGEVLRPELAKIVFGPAPLGPHALGKLERITHPRIAERLQRQIDDLRSSDVAAVVLDAPVMFKAGWDQFCDHIVFVSADDAIRRERAAMRGWTESQWRSREAAQTPLPWQMARSTATLDNSHSVEHIRAQVQKLWQQWIGTPTAC